LDSISSPGLDVSRLTPLCGKSHRAGLAGNRYVGRCWDLQRSRNGFPQWDARLTYGRPTSQGRDNRRSGALGRRSRFPARPLRWSDLDRLLELADGPAPCQISIPEPAIGECVQQFGRHDNKEVHVVMT